MEPSQIFGVSEECHSSESGWTMYIGSPANGSSDADANADVDAGSGSGSDDENGKSKGFYANNNRDDDDDDDDESDDSMASDASSGPSNHQQQQIRERQRHPFGGNGLELALFNQQNEVKFCLETKAKKKQRSERNEVKEKLVLKGQKSKSSVDQSCSKVRKSIFMGKRN